MNGYSYLKSTAGVRLYDVILLQLVCMHLAYEWDSRREIASNGQGSKGIS